MSGLRCFIYISAVVIYGIEIVFFWTISDLLHCTNEPNVSIPQLANLLIERSQNSNWVVVFKSLVTTHHLMCYGNEVLYLVFPKFRNTHSTYFYFHLTAIHTVSGLEQL